LVPSRFHEWIHVFGEKISERMPKKKDVESCNQIEKRICAKKGEGVSVVKGRERRST